MNALLLMLLLGSNSISLTSADFANNGNIPAKFTCEGKDISPELSISGVPPEAVTLALVVDDPDADKKIVTHWIVWNIPANTTTIKQNSKPGTEGKNEKGTNAYMGPCPPTDTHHYHFNIYALDRRIDLPAGSTKEQLLKAIEGHIIASGELIGLYKKEK